MHAFEEYLKAHTLNPVERAVFAKVRYRTIWNAMKGNPITPEHAQQISMAVLLLTGVSYGGTFTLIQTIPVEEQPTLPLRKVKLVK